MDGIDGLAASEGTFVAWGRALVAALGPAADGVWQPAVVVGAACCGFSAVELAAGEDLHEGRGQRLPGYLVAVLTVAAAAPIGGAVRMADSGRGLLVRCHGDPGAARPAWPVGAHRSSQSCISAAGTPLGTPPRRCARHQPSVAPAVGGVRRAASRPGTCLHTGCAAAAHRTDVARRRRRTRARGAVTRARPVASTRAYIAASRARPHPGVATACAQALKALSSGRCGVLAAATAG